MNSRRAITGVGKYFIVEICVQIATIKTTQKAIGKILSKRLIILNTIVILL